MPLVYWEKKAFFGTSPRSIERPTYHANPQNEAHQRILGSRSLKPPGTVLNEPTLLTGPSTRRQLYPTPPGQYHPQGSWLMRSRGSGCVASLPKKHPSALPCPAFWACRHYHLIDCISVTCPAAKQQGIARTAKRCDAAPRWGQR